MSRGHRRSAPSAAGCGEAPVLRERGQREVFCGLTGIIWLHRKIQDAFFLVVGSRTCAHLIQSAAGVMIFAEPRFATAIIDERDLAGLADAQRRTRPRRRRACSSAGPTSAAVPGRLLPVGSHQARPVARRRSACRQRFAPRVRVLNYSGSGIETTFTQGEDACLAALVPELPAADADAPPSLLVVGALADVVEDQFARLFAQLGIGPVHFLPPRRAARPAAVGPNTRFLLAQPFLADTARALEERGAQRICRRPSRSASKARRAGCEAAADGLRRRAPARFEQVTAPRRARARRRRWRATATRSPASASSSSPIRSSRSRWRASCRANWACAWSRSARPTCTASTWPQELALLPAGTALSEGQDVERQLDRCRAARPDIVVCGLGLANPLEAEGIDHQVVDRTGVHAHPGLRAGRRPGRTVRAPAAPPHAAGGLNGMQTMQLTLWTYEGPPHVGAMRIATAMQGVHYVLHAPQGDTYADLLFTMIERRDRAPAGHLHHLPGARPGRRHRRAVQDRRARGLRALPAAGDDGRRVLHRRADPGRPGRPGRGAATCRSRSCRSSCPSYQRKENWGAAETFYQLVRALCGPAVPAPGTQRARVAGQRRPRCNMLGPTRWASAIATTCARSPACSGAGRRRQRRRAAGRHAGRPGAPGRGRLQRRALPRDRRRPRRWLAAHLRPAGTCRPCRSASARRATSSPKWRRWPASIRRAALDEPTLALALVLALGRLDLPHRQARLRLRRRHARHRRGARRAARNSASPSSASAPTAANSPARCARPPSSTASRR